MCVPWIGVWYRHREGTCLVELGPQERGDQVWGQDGRLYYHDNVELKKGEGRSNRVMWGVLKEPGLGWRGLNSTLATLRLPEQHS